ncbi:hypothetical protein ACKKBG_A10015 [Auxenochlorella protothecoides x Auxenochlorella symbiontica]
MGPPVTEVRRHLSWGMFAAYLMFGSGFLVSWNAIFSIANYWITRYPGKNSINLFTIVYLPVNLVTVLITTRWHSSMPTHTRIIVGYGGATLCLATILLVTLAPGNDASLAGTLAATGVCSIFDAVSHPAMYAEAALRPPQYTRVLVLGASLAGVVNNILRIITMAAFDSEADGLANGARIFLALAALWTGACTVLYPLLRRRGLLVEAGPGARLEAGEGEQDPDAEPVEKEGQEGPKPGKEDHAALAVAPGEALQGRAAVLQVIRDTWRLCVALILIYIVTLSIFPGVLVEDAHSSRLGGWYPIILVTIYNVGDMLGRILPATFAALVWTGQNIILISSSIRLLFLPAIFFGVQVVPVMAVLTFLLGFSNGLFTSHAMAAGPSHVHPTLSDMAGSVMVLALIVGLNIGAGLSFLWLLE